MIAITGVSLLAGGSAHEHITHVQWLDTDNGKTSRPTVALMVSYAEQGNALYVGGDDGWNAVQVVRPAGRAPYLRSVKDSTPTNNLLYLPRF
jgi:hypothetical protein